ncbi:MAG: hypothetical protein JWQ38_3640 [Flavipsychrobacter sp.]|nr:hypothetical protein [Flavipsychrobacter sp.]
MNLSAPSTSCTWFIVIYILKIMKRIQTCLIRLLCLIILLLAGSISSYANHLVGMDLYYTHVSGNTYKITLVAYGDCGSAGTSSAFSTLPFNTPAINIYNGSSYYTTINLSIEPPSTGVEITPVCARDLLLTQCTNLSYTIPGIKKFVYSANYTLPGPSTSWSFLFTGNMGTSSIAGRAISITNISSTPVTYIQLEATLNNSVANNSSPTLAVIPTPYFCVNNSDNYNPGAVDIDGDVLSFKLVTGMDGTTGTARGTPVTYLGGHTSTAPLTTSSFSFDNLTGQISFYPNALQRSLVVYNIEERRGGTLIGTCQREMTFLVLTCSNVAASGGLTSATNGVIDDSTHFHVCEGAGAFSMKIDPTEPVKSNNIFVTTAGLPTGSTFTTVGNGTNAPHCTFSWSTIGVAPGSYTFYVTYTDDNCPLAGVTTLAYTITILPNPSISYTSIASATCTEKGAVSLIPGGGGSPWTIKVSRSPGDTIQTLTGITGAVVDSLAPGTYTATIFSSVSSNCNTSASITIASPPAITITGTFTNPTFCGNNDGTIKLHGLNPGETDTIKFMLDGVPQTPQVVKAAPDGTATISGLYSGKYTAITATYGSYCVSKPAGPITLTDPPFTMRALKHTDPDYCGVCNGTITLYGLHPGQIDTITYTIGGVPQTPVVFTIGSDSTVTLTGLCNGTYANFYAKTGKSCISNKLGPVLLAVPPFTIRSVTSTQPDYCGVCNGTITIHGVHPGMVDSINYTMGGVPQPTVFQYVGTDSLITFTGLCASTYDKFYVRFGTSCGSNKLGPVLLAVPPFTMRSVTYTNPDYCGVCNGVIVLHGLHPGQTDTINYTYNGVAQPPIYRVIPPDSTVTITSLCPGIYDKFVAKTGGICVSNTLGPVTLTVPPFTMRTLSSTNPDYCGICNGTIKIYGLHPGQTDTINYTMDGVPQAPVRRLVGADSTITITGLCAGVYDNFIATTGGVCVSNTLGPVMLTVPPFTMRALTATNPDYCGICNGTIKIYGLHPGQTDTIYFTKDGGAMPYVSGKISADSTITITGLCAGVYDNFIAKTGGVCVSNTLGPITLTVPPFTMRAISSTNPDYCGICNGTITLYGLHPGQTDTINYTIGGSAQPPISSFVGADSTIVLTGLCAGLYDNFYASTGGVCLSNKLGPVNLTVPPFTMRSLTHTDPEFCGICDGSITLYGLHPGQTDTIYYTIGGVAQTPIIQNIAGDSLVKMTALCAGTYANFVAKTGGVCASNVLGPVDLVVPPFTMRKLTYINPTKCGYCDGSIKLYGLYPGQTDTITYTLDGLDQTPIARVIGGDSTVTLTGLCEGTYSNFIAHTGGVCATNSLGPAPLDAPPITANYTYDLRKNCKADTVYFTNKSTPASDLAYVWDFGDGSEKSSATNPKHIYNKAGVMKAMVTITNGKCYDSAIQNINIDNLIEASFTSTPDSYLCQNNEVAFSSKVSGTDLKYMWFFGDGNVDNAAQPKHTYVNTGNYTVSMIVSNYVPCYDTIVKTLAVDSNSYASITATDTVLCAGHNVTFRGAYARSGLKNITWTFSDGTTLVDTSIVVHPFDVAGNFPVNMKAYYRACPDTMASKNVLVFGIPELYLGPDTSICIGSFAISLADEKNNNNKRARWLWSTGETTSSIVVVQPGQYSATVAVYGCTATDTVTVLNDCYMNIPNVFSPNGDGTNDYFFPRGLLTRGLTTFKMDIFNRWGQQIFSSNSIDGRGWDGTFNGVAQPEGVFIYRIEATFKDGQIEKHQGNVTLIR